MYRQMSCLLLAASCVVILVAADMASDVGNTANDRFNQAFANNQGTPGVHNNVGTAIVTSNSNTPGLSSSSVSQTCTMVDGKQVCTENRNTTVNGNTVAIVNSPVPAVATPAPAQGAATPAPVATVEVKQEVKPAAPATPVAPAPPAKVTGNNSASNLFVSCSLIALLAVLARLA